MQGLSEVCQNPHCAKKAMFWYRSFPNDDPSCNRCFKRTYCSEECQIADWPEHKWQCRFRVSSRKQCYINEKGDEIKKQFDALKAKYGSVFEEKDCEKRQRDTKTAKITKPKKQRKEKKVEIAYNGSLLPFCLETVNNYFVDFLELLQQYHFLVCLI